MIAAEWPLPGSPGGFSGGWPDDAAADQPLTVVGQGEIMDALAPLNLGGELAIFLRLLRRCMMDEDDVDDDEENAIKK